MLQQGNVLYFSDSSLATKQFIGIKLSSLALSQFVKYMYSSRLIRLWLMVLEFSIFLKVKVPDELICTGFFSQGRAKLGAILRHYCGSHLTSPFLGPKNQ